MTHLRPIDTIGPARIDALARQIETAKDTTP